MSRFLYTKFAWTGIRKNKQLYYPYLIAGIMMVMVFYIFVFLAASDVVHGLPGGEAVTELFHIGSWLVGLFSVPFLFYTNSTLIRRRKRELGLYNILGMNKKNLFFILFWEALITYGICVSGGIFSGVVLSKTAELGIVNIMGRATDYHIYIEWKGVRDAVIIFAIIFFLILMNMLRQIHSNNPVELMRSESAGERPPKNHWLFAAISLCLIVAAYIVAVRLDTPKQAVQYCFAIAGMIIAGTFLLFICASVLLCKILKSKKKYYYKTAHFVTVSSMEYRMKRNGASLASICSLVTLILVTLTAAVGFYAGFENRIEDYYPYDIGIAVDIPVEKAAVELSAGSYTKDLRQGIEKVMQGKDAVGAEGLEIYSCNMLALLSKGQIILGEGLRNKKDGSPVLLRILTKEAYEKICGISLELPGDKVLAASDDVSGQLAGIVLHNGTTIPVDKRFSQIPRLSVMREYNQKADEGKIRQIFLIVSNMSSLIRQKPDIDYYAKNNDLIYRFEYNIKMPEDKDRQSRVYEAIRKQAKNADCYLRSERSERIHGLSGGLLFLMLVMIIIFAFVTTLIMYYKQISEGYEDQKRFLIMRKLGMTRKEIKKSINSQILTVFSLPLITAGFHLVFTSQIIYLLMQYAMIDDRALIFRVMSISFGAFAIVYSFVYFLTSRTYFRIVNRSVDDVLK